MKYNLFTKRLLLLVLMQFSRLSHATEPVAAAVSSAPTPALAPAPAAPSWPAGMVYLGDDCSVYGSRRPDSWGLSIRINESRAYTQFDLPSPSKIGRKLWALVPAAPGSTPRLLLDAGKGAIGSPSVTYDGASVLISLATEGESFFHIWRVPVAGGKPQRLTDGPFHDTDPCEMPDGRIVFSSTRIGTFEEYHAGPSRALFTMQADGREIRQLTATSIFDNEPKIMSDGRIVFVRSDNFFDRSKVETTIHIMHPDGTSGMAAFAADLGPAYGNRLRNYGYGSPAPLPDGRLACIAKNGNLLGRPGEVEANCQKLPNNLGDISPLPDGRLLCSIVKDMMENNAKRRFPLALAVFDPASNKMESIFEGGDSPVHSPVYLGPRPRPPSALAEYKMDATAGQTATGFLHCQNVLRTRNTQAGWDYVRAIRVLAAKPLTTRSSHSHIVHAGTEAVELGTVPLAPDGSFSIEVPADTPIALQAVDAEGRSELNQMSWMFVRPGEHRSCIGCHQPRQMAPSVSAGQAVALRAVPLKTLGQGQPNHFRGNSAAVNGLMDLQFERFRENASLNLRDNSPAGTGPANEVTNLIAACTGREVGLRISSAQRLALLRDRRAAPVLAGMLTSKDREERTAAAVALAACGTRASVPALITALEDADALVAQAAAMALENLTGRACAVSGFAPRAERSKAARTWQEAFTADGWDAIEGKLITQLPGTDRVAQRKAAIALGHVAGDAGRSALRRFVETEKTRFTYPPYLNNRTDNFTYDDASPLNPRLLQSAVRALGHLKDVEAVPLLTTSLHDNLWRKTANLYLAEAAAEALGRIATPEAEKALIDAFAKMDEYTRYVGWYGDHDALWACHSSPVHARIIEALDAMGSTQAAPLVPQLLRSVPTDTDRALFLGSDDYEKLVGRVVRRSGLEAQVMDACLARLGDPVKPNLSFAGLTPTASDLQGASWIWHAADGEKPAPGTRRFRIDFDLPSDCLIATAAAVITADNSYQLEINGKTACLGENWQSPQMVDPKHLLKAGRNSLVVQAINAGKNPKPAGLVLKLTVGMEVGNSVEVMTGQGAWESTAAATGDDGWAPVRIVGPLNCAPWSALTAKKEDTDGVLLRCQSAWGGTPDAPIRAAQIISLLCRDRAYEPRIRAALERYAALPPEVVKRTVGKNKDTLPRRNWVLFFLGRSLANLADPASAPVLMDILTKAPTEAAQGRPDPSEPNSLYLHLDATPCWRASLANALGNIGDKRAVPVLANIVATLDNAPDTRHAAAEALGRIGDPASRDLLQKLAKDYPEVSTRKALLTASDQVIRAKP